MFQLEHPDNALWMSNSAKRKRNRLAEPDDASALLQTKRTMQQISIFENLSEREEYADAKRTQDIQISWLSGGDGTLSDDDRDKHQSTFTMHENHVIMSLSFQRDPLDDRLSILQHLLPRGSELAKHEILTVAMDYVKDLEKEIQMFKPEDVHFTSSGSEISSGSDVGTLQKKGLCVVPVSSLLAF